MGVTARGVSPIAVALAHLAAAQDCHMHFMLQVLMCECFLVLHVQRISFCVEGVRVAGWAREAEMQVARTG
jgi:hypothetical protein